MSSYEDKLYLDTRRSSALQLVEIDWEGASVHVYDM